MLKRGDSGFLDEIRVAALTRRCYPMRSTTKPIHDQAMGSGVDPSMTSL